ncbi:MAG: hypothetical protein JXM70_00885 [Pirellulales bacterium]|nr:hypothetical protein [Pirellulales bacterium]
MAPFGTPATFSGTFDLDTGTTARESSAFRDASVLEFTTTGLGSGALATASIAAGAERNVGGASGVETGGATVLADIERMG